MQTPHSEKLLCCSKSPPLQKAQGWGNLKYVSRSAFRTAAQRAVRRVRGDLRQALSLMIDKTFADRFAAEWIAAWNGHDLDRVLSHYSDDFEMSSPFIAPIAGEASAKLKGKKAVRAYWSKALQLNPNLHFKMVSTLVGVSSITIYYQGVRGMVAEVFHFGSDGKVTEAFAHYAG
jgi:SnoaL-like domain